MSILSSFFKKKKKVSIFRTDDSFRLITYSSLSGKSEAIWNNTNLIPPNKIISKDKKEYLTKVESSEFPIMNRILKSGDRYFRYKTKDEIFKDRIDLLKVGWANNVQDCNKRYNNFKEYLEVGISQINKRILILDTKK